MATPTYDLLEEILRTPRQVVWRAVRRPDGLNVLLKEQVAPFIRAGALQQEFELTHQLALNGLPPHSRIRRTQ